METRTEVGERLRERRQHKGNPSFRRIERWVVTRWADVPSSEMIRRYHVGTGPEPEDMDVALLAALAEYYDCRLSDLSETVADRAIPLRDLLVRQSP